MVQEPGDRGSWFKGTFSSNMVALPVPLGRALIDTDLDLSQEQFGFVVESLLETQDYNSFLTVPVDVNSFYCVSWKIRQGLSLIHI